MYAIVLDLDGEAAYIIRKIKLKLKIIKRAYRNKTLTNAEHKANYKHSKTRLRVEYIFGALTSQMNNALNLTIELVT